MRDIRQARSVAAVLDVAAAFATLGCYWLRVVPQARYELRRWRRLAHAIPTTELRTFALETLSGEAMNSEAAAVFAVLAPRRYRSTLTRLAVAYQVMYDYLDTLSEHAESATASLQLHTALTAALEPDTSGGDPDYYARHRVNDDGGYLRALVRACRTSIAALPAASLVRPFARQAAVRCACAQSYTHVAHRDGAQQLQTWAEETVKRQNLAYLWWEVGAAGISSLGIHALLAAAAHADLGEDEPQLIDAAYFPSVCALSTLFDSLIDAGEDAITGNHSYLGYYVDAAAAGTRLVTIVHEAVNRLDRLRGARLHRTILAGVAAFYLSAATARAGDANTITEQTLAALGSAILPILWTLRLRRLVKAVATLVRCGRSSTP